MSIHDINQLDIKEKIILINKIWESIESTPQEIESPKWHQDIIENRIDKIKNGKAEFISIEELKNI